MDGVVGRLHFDSGKVCCHCEMLPHGVLKLPVVVLLKSLFSPLSSIYLK